jgi:hypothetical protein
MVHCAYGLALCLMRGTTAVFVHHVTARQPNETVGNEFAPFSGADDSSRSHSYDEPRKHVAARGSFAT